MFSALYLHSWERWRYASTKFFVRNLIFRPLLFEVFFVIIVIFCSIWSQSEPTFPFQYIIIFIIKITNVCSLPSSTCVGMKTCAQWAFCRKLNFMQLLFGVFFNIIGIFGSIHSKNEPTFHSSAYLKNGKRWALPISTHGGDGGTSPPSFL